MMKKQLRSVFVSLLALCAFNSATAQNSVILSWPFDKGLDSPSSAVITGDDVFSAASYSVGSNILEKPTVSTRDEYTFKRFEPAANIANSVTGNSDNFITFTIIPKKGISFIPSGLKFAGTKYGTSGGNITVNCFTADSEKINLINNFNLQRDNQLDNYSVFSNTISGLKAADCAFTITFEVSNLNNGKEMGLSSIIVEGTYEGTVIEVPAYTLSTSLSDENAGVVTANPSLEKYDEGSEITLSATENFSYHFQGWENTAGEIVSTANPYKFTIGDNTSLKAVYSKNNAYILDLNISDNANSNLVDISPVGTFINGKRYYEEGTEVMLTAINNPILTFTHWDDNSTSTQRFITINSDLSLSAEFSARDYIVGWDMYNDSPSSDRPADYKSDSENAGMLTMRNSTSSSSWLAKGVNAGLYNGKYCAVNWRPFRVDASDSGALISEDLIYNYIISFSTVGYTNIEVMSSMGCNYNAYEKQIVEYSLDGVNYIQINTITLPEVKSWTNDVTSLPAECENQSKVYVRFRGDMTSTVKGTVSGNNGTCITDIFVLADAEIVDDTTAPVLLSSNPKNNDTGISANGSIVLVFDETVVEGNGNCILDGEVLSARFSGKTVVFPYSGLKYNTTYTFSLPAGKILDRSGNAFEGTEITFTTMERQQPTARLFDMIIASDGSGDYTTIQDAVDAAPANMVRPYLIFVKNGTYKGHVDIPETKTYLHFIGQNKDKVIITDDRLCGEHNGVPGVHVSIGATVVCKAANTMFENITFENSFGVINNSGPQALALYSNNDRMVFNNCKMLSYQDTWLTSTKRFSDRHYAKNCFIEGAVDFIYGGSDVYFDDCTINIVRSSGGYIVAPNHVAETKWGYVFMNNTITTSQVADPSTYSVWLGRPWQNEPKTVFINTIAEVTIPAGGWYQTMGGLPALWAEYNTMDKNGKPVDLSNRNTYYYKKDSNGNISEERFDVQAVLSAEEAAAYTIKNVLSGDDAWDPALMTEPCEKPNGYISDNKLTWSEVPYAICYLITNGEDVIGFTTECEFSVSGEGNYMIQAINEFGGLSEAASFETTSLKETEKSLTIVSVKYFSVDGIQRVEAEKGINIVQYRMNDGSVKTEKVFIR